MKIVVVGTGYVGLVTAVCLAEIGHNVTCIDIKKDKIEKLNRGESPIFEPGLEQLMLKNKKLLSYTIDYKKAYKDADIIFIGVGTPEKEDGSADLKYVFTVTKDIANNIEKDCIVAVKSTVPVGTNDRIERFITNNLRKKVKVEVVSNPEFLSQGTAIRDTLYGQRIVLGVSSKNAEEIMKKVYEGCKQKYIITDRKSAEMIKYASNDFLALKISYINEIANLCEIIGADIEDVARGMGMDARIGNKFLKAGIGYGGSCFPKDTKALHWLAEFNNYELKTVKATIEVNQRQKMKLIKKARKYYESFEGIKVAVLGVTFKPNTDDLRESPALDNIRILLENGAKVKVYDPIGEDNLKKIFKDKKEIDYCLSIEETLKDTEICFIFTDWDCIKMIDLNWFSKLMKMPIIIDGRNCFELDRIPNGIIYESIGRRVIKNS